MNQMSILYPMLALVGWTLLVLNLVGVRRVKAGSARLVHPQKDFALGESAAVPPGVSLPNRNFMNLLEVPVLFYVVGMLFYVTQRVDALALMLAWTFVALRVAHTVIHLSYNKVIHRAVVFAVGNVVVTVLFIELLVKLAR